MRLDLLGAEASARLRDLNNSGSQQQYFHRTSDEVARFFDGTNLVPPVPQ